MIDLIIPHYNNIEGLKRTLASIDTHIFDVLVLDDASTDDISFIKSLPKHYLFLHNCGPGKVRQHGLRITDKSYVMFMDAGDVFTSFEAQQGIAAAAYAYPDVNVFSFPYFHKGKLTKETDNRIHGKLYKREFLDKYDISFAPESSYLNEDIGFNRTCRLCTEAENQPIFFGKLPVLD
jgi:glycosyltransferase involved in cell wall biosynthesis